MIISNIQIYNNNFGKRKKCNNNDKFNHPKKSPLKTIGEAVDRTMVKGLRKFERGMDIITPKVERALDKTLGKGTKAIEKGIEVITPSDETLDKTLGKGLKVIEKGIEAFRNAGYFILGDTDKDSSGEF